VDWQVRSVARAASLAWLGVVTIAAGQSACAPAAARAPVAPAPVQAEEPTSLSSTPAAAPEAPAHHRQELPRGGRTLFPDYELVGFCGTPGAAPALGRLAGNLAAVSKKLQSYADKYAGHRKIMPVFELIAVVVQAFPGSDGKYRRRVDDSVVERYLRAAREAQGILLLNIQPGWSDFPTEVRHFEKYLHEPDVGIALDPEWAMSHGQMPGRVYGHTTGTVIDDVAEYLSSIVVHDDLPEKALVFHHVNSWVVRDEKAVKAHPGVVIIDSVDGLGPKALKINTYDYLMTLEAPVMHPGFKLFFDEDRENGGRLMTPAEVLALHPPPEYVMYE